MPELNPSLPSIFIAGNAGDGGVISSNDARVVIGPSAGNAHWLNSREAACQYYTPNRPPTLVAVDVFSGLVRDLWLHGVNKIVAGAGHWFADKILDGLPVDYNVRAFAGSYMAWFPWNGTGLTVRGPSGDAFLSTTLGPEEPIQLFPDGSCLWAEAGRVFAHRINGFPAQAVITPGGFGWVKAFRIGGVWWLAYQSYELAAVVCHPAHELRGYRWPAPNAYRLDAALLIDGRPRIIWSRGAADSPADIEVHDVDLSQPRIDLGVPVIEPPPPPPPPRKLMEDKSKFVAEHPMRSILGTPKGAGKEMDRAWNAFRFVCAVARDLGPDWGVEKDPSGDYRPVINEVGYWGDGLRTRNAGVDIVASREDESAHPAWGTVGPADETGERGFMSPPSDADIVRAMGGVPIDPPPPPPPPPGDLGAKLAALELRVTHLETRKLVLAVREE